MEFTLNFIAFFLQAIYLLFPLLLFFILVIVLLGQIVGRIEGWSKFDSFYWSFITAITVGYGDIRPLKKSSKAISIAVALVGIMFTGVIVALTVTTATEAFKKHFDIKSAQDYIEKNIEPKHGNNSNMIGD